MGIRKAEKSRKGDNSNWTPLALLIINTYRGTLWIYLSLIFFLSATGVIETVFGRFGNHDGQFQMGHDVAIGEDGAVYVVDIIGERVQKFVSE